MAEKTYSVAEARQNFARLIRSAERGKAIEITRRGEPVAVLSPRRSTSPSRRSGLGSWKR